MTDYQYRPKASFGAPRVEKLLAALFVGALLTFSGCPHPTDYRWDGFESRCYRENEQGLRGYVSDRSCDCVRGIRPCPGGYHTSGGRGSVHVRGYHRRDGTYVRSHTRRAPRR